MQISRIKALIAIIIAFILCFSANSYAQIGLEEKIQKGKEMYLAGDYEEGIIFLQKVVKRFPKSADAWYWLGKCYEKLGYFDAAQECYIRALSLNPRYKALSEAILKMEKKVKSPPPDTIPRLLKDVRKIAVISVPSDGSLQGNGSSVNVSILGKTREVVVKRERVEPLAEAVAREITSRLVKFKKIKVLANPLFDNDIKKLAKEADLLILVSFTSSREKVGFRASDFAVNVRIIDPISKTIEWEQNIWIADLVKDIYKAVRSRRLSTMLVYTEIPLLFSGESQVIAVGTAINFMIWLINETMPAFLPIGGLTRTELLTAFAALTKKITDRIFKYWELSPTIHPMRLDLEKIEAEKHKLEWLKKRGIVAQIAWINNKGKVVINAGADKGVRKGDRFFVFRKGRPIIDPATNEVVGYDELIIGYLEINMVREKISFGRITKWIRKDIAVGDWVRKIVNYK